MQLGWEECSKLLQREEGEGGGVGWGWERERGRENRSVLQSAPLLTDQDSGVGFLLVRLAAVLSIHALCL